MREILVPTGGLVPPVGDKISSMWSQYCLFYGVLKYDKNQGYRTGLVTVLDKSGYKRFSNQTLIYTSLKCKTPLDKVTIKILFYFVNV